MVKLHRRFSLYCAMKIMVDMCHSYVIECLNNVSTSRYFPASHFPQRIIWTGPFSISAIFFHCKSSPSLQL